MEELNEGLWGWVGGKIGGGEVTDDVGAESVEYCSGLECILCLLIKCILRFFVKLLDDVHRDGGVSGLAR